MHSKWFVEISQMHRIFAGMIFVSSPENDISIIELGGGNYFL